MDHNIQTVKYVDASDLAPTDWQGWFWGEFSHGAPFSWGDNSHSLVHKDAFHDHCADVLGNYFDGIEIDPDFPDDRDDLRLECQAFLRRLQELPGDVYINLES